MSSLDAYYSELRDIVESDPDTFTSATRSQATHLGGYALGYGSLFAFPTLLNFPPLGFLTGANPLVYLLSGVGLIGFSAIRGLTRRAKAYSAEKFMDETGLYPTSYGMDGPRGVSPVDVNLEDIPPERRKAAKVQELAQKKQIRDTKYHSFTGTLNSGLIPSLFSVIFGPVVAISYIPLQLIGAIDDYRRKINIDRGTKIAKYLKQRNPDGFDVFKDDMITSTVYRQAEQVGIDPDDTENYQT